MAIYHLSIKVIGRSHGRSAVSAAAYRAGERLCDYDTGTVHDYTHKGGVILSEIILPENAPESYRDRETLWNLVQKIEKNANAQLAREIEVALPNDIPRDWQIECVRNYIKRTFVSAGMCADWALHDKGDGNPHAHILLTMRQIKPDGTWDVKKRNQYVLDENGNKIPVIDKKTGLQKVEKKTGRKVWERCTVEVNDWNDQGKAEEWREAWADHINFYLTREEQVDHRSFERQGIDKEPTIHEGYVARQMEQKGRVADRCQVNRDIRERNRIRDWIRKKIKKLTIKIETLFREKEANAYDEIKRIIERRNQKQSYGDSDDGIYSGGIEEATEGYRYTSEKEYGAGDGFDEGLADELHAENERARKLLDDISFAEQTSGAIRDYHISQRHDRDNERKRQDTERKPEIMPEGREPEKRSIEHKGRVR